MALATKCPHCQTTFRVAHDQLKLRAGLVRCGACKQIFNGIEHLVAPGDPSTPAVSPSPAAPSLPAAPAVSDAHATAEPTAFPATIAENTHAEPLAGEEAKPSAPPAVPAAPSPLTDTLDFVTVDGLDAAGASPSQEAAAPTVETPDAAHSEDEDPLRRMTLVDFSAVDDWEDTPKPEDAATSADTVTGDAGDAAAQPAAEPPGLDLEADTHHDELPTGVLPDDEPGPSPADESDTVGNFEEPSTPEVSNAAVADVKQDSVDELDEDAATDEPGFVTRERAREKRRHMSRIVFGIGSLLLLLGALAQGTYAFRDRMAAWFPQTKPTLDQLCRMVGCQVRLPAQIDMVSIESHELHSLAPDKNVFALTLLLRNRSTFTQAWPAIELTLNDGDEKPLVRRVLSPADYLASAPEIARGFAPQSEQPVKVSFELMQTKASGYRVYLFYP